MDIFRKRRSIRRYTGDVVKKELIVDLIDKARLYPSAGNLQPVRFLSTNRPSTIEKALSFLRWASYVRPRRDPVPGKGPGALVLVCHDREVSNSPFVPYDVGSAVQTLLLACVERGLGACWLGAIDKEGLRSLFRVPGHWEIHCVVALGYPAEEPVVDPVVDGDIRYFLDENDVLHVPKRSLEEVFRWIE